jgi:hypothetical protein
MKAQVPFDDQLEDVVGEEVEGEYAPEFEDGSYLL